MTSEEARLEGLFRMAHSRIMTNSEDLAFYNGEQREKSILNKTYSNLIKHINQTYRTKISFNMLEDFIIKYCWSAVGLIIASIPVFMPDYAGGRTKQYELQLSKLDKAEGGAKDMSRKYNWPLQRSYFTPEGHWFEIYYIW